MVMLMDDVRWAGGYDELQSTNRRHKEEHRAVSMEKM